jgi:hypothetical protein
MIRPGNINNARMAGLPAPGVARPKTRDNKDDKAHGKEGRERPSLICSTDDTYRTSDR